MERLDLVETGYRAKALLAEAAAEQAAARQGLGKRAGDDNGAAEESVEEPKFPERHLAGLRCIWVGEESPPPRVAPSVGSPDDRPLPPDYLVLCFHRMPGA